MPTNPQPDNRQSDFTRRSDTESVCLYCYATVRSDYADLLRLEERLHLIICTAAPKK